MKKKYVKDYIPESNGNTTYRYVGDFYVSEIDDKQRKKSGLLQMIYAALSMALTFAALCINCIGNHTIYVVIPLECTLVCYAYYISGAYAFLKCDNRMEQRMYDAAFIRTVQSATIAMIINIFSFIGELIVVITNRKSIEGAGEYFLLIWILFMAVVNGIAWSYQRRLIAGVHKEERKKEEKEDNVS